MSTQTTNYQCPLCTGPLHYSGKTGKLECDYCASSFSVNEIEELYASKNQKAEQNFKSDSQEEYKSYICPSCSAELICDLHTSATRCPYCGNPTVVPGQFQGTLQPDLILPFRLSHDDATSALKNYYKNKKFLPDAFKDENTIQEIQGVYVPFWLYTGTAEINAVFNASRSFTSTQGQYRITKTDHYEIHRVAKVPFKQIPADASKRISDKHMDAIEPFNYDELKTFSKGYLPGFLAESYSVSCEEASSKAQDRATQSAIETVLQDIQGYETISTQNKHVVFEETKHQLALLPVYLLTTRYQNQPYLFAMNGQTGKFIGNLPIDKKKYWMHFAGIFVGVSALLSTILYLIF